MDNFYKDIKATIDRAGQQVLAVFPDEDGDLPFAYTIGNHEHGLPELLMIGLASDGAAAVLNAIGQMQRTVGHAFKDGEIVDIGAPCNLKVIDANDTAKKDYTIQAGYFYGTENYKVQQVIIPDRYGHFPGEIGCAEPFASFPVLYRS